MNWVEGGGELITLLFCSPDGRRSSGGLGANAHGDGSDGGDMLSRAVEPASDVSEAGVAEAGVADVPMGWGLGLQGAGGTKVEIVADLPSSICEREPTAQTLAQRENAYKSRTCRMTQHCPFIELRGLSYCHSIKPLFQALNPSKQLTSPSWHRKAFGWGTHT